MPVSLDSSLAFPELAAKLQPEPRTAPERALGPQFAEALARASIARGDASAPGASDGGLVQATRTRLSGQQAARALAGAWQNMTGQPPTPKTLSILVGQWAHETGRGSAMLNYNFGGIKGTGPSGMSAVYKTREGWGENEVRISDRFRAYTSAEEGAEDYVGLLARRYPDAVRAAESEDPVAFVQALKARGYFTGNETSYVKSVTALANQALTEGFDALGASDEAGAPSPFVLAARAAAVPERSSAPVGLAAEHSEAAGATPARARWEQNSFADEVNRAALLMSALRIGQTDERRG